MYIQFYKISWNALKNKRLKKVRGVSFQEIIKAKLLGIIKSPHRAHQDILVYEYRNYVWAVPCVFEQQEVFLKTIYPSRKLMKFFKGDY